jgi:NAD-dependent dihydropyrimidine dehydrogenase PreA subunit
MKRNIIEIDESKCDGCGQCVSACAEGALQLIDGKARLVKDIYCDGLGACIGECPTGALKVVQREAAEFDEKAVEERLAEIKRPAAASAHTAPPAGGCPSMAFLQNRPPSGGCPGTAQRQFGASKPAVAQAVAVEEREIPSALTHWPIQLHLANPAAPQYAGADILIAADCTAFSLGSFHRDLLEGRSLLIACPKLDDTGPYQDKLTALFETARPNSVTVARMQVPCCSGILRLVSAAREQAGSKTPIRDIVVGIEGGILSDETLA